MYNKLFTKILDSSIWLAPDPHRLVWITLLAAMDEDGNAMFACVDNVAARARVNVEDAESAIKAFEAPDRKSGDPENEGRRIERFPGGWHVLNAHKYRSQVTKAIIREQTRVRVAEYRARNAKVTQANEPVAPSVSLSKAPSSADEKTPRKRAAPAAPMQCPPDVDPQVWADWLELRKKKRAPVTMTVIKGAQDEARKAGMPLEAFLAVWCRRGSQGLEADWLKPEERGQWLRGGRNNQPMTSTEERNRAAKALLGIQDFDTIEGN
jgi:hypothetical protein